MVFTAFALIHDLFFVSNQTVPVALGTESEANDGHADPTKASADDSGGDENSAAANADSGGHADPVAPVLLAIVMILFLAKIGGDLFERISMPAVLGELVVGIVLGNFAFLTGWHGLDFFEAPPENKFVHVMEKIENYGFGNLSEHDQHIIDTAQDKSETLSAILEKGQSDNHYQLTPDEHETIKLAGNINPYNTGAILKMLAGIGVVLLLFEVGLESTVREMMSVGLSSGLVAILGVVFPMGLGYGVGLWLIPDAGWQVHCFIGATLCATSVGITARVLKDLGRSQQRESKIILGAAVIDDVLGLIVLAIVSGVIAQGSVSAGGIAIVVIKAVGFLVAAIVLGNFLFTNPLFKAASFLRGRGLLVATSLVICFGFAWLANLFGLAPIVGAFAAGLILEHTHYRELGEREQTRSLEDALAPLSALLVPIFFVQMGIQVDLSSFADPSVWGLAAAITAAAIIGKQVCAFGVVEKGMNKIAVGLGMIPRGEVGLIFADVGRNLSTPAGRVIDDQTFSAIVVMVILTTMVTPPLLKWAMSRGPQPQSDV